MRRNTLKLLSLLILGVIFIGSAHASDDVKKICDKRVKATEKALRKADKSVGKAERNVTRAQDRVGREQDKCDRRLEKFREQEEELKAQRVWGGAACIAEMLLQSGGNFAYAAEYCGRIVAKASLKIESISAKRRKREEICNRKVGRYQGRVTEEQTKLSSAQTSQSSANADYKKALCECLQQCSA